MGRKKKIIPPPKIPCSHCLVYQNSKRSLDNGRVRFCSFLKKDIEGDELGASTCAGFKASSFFWCEKHQQRISVSICLNRKAKKIAECKRCSTHSVILEIKKRENGQLTVSSWRKPCRLGVGRAEPEEKPCKADVCRSKSWRVR